MVHISFGFDGCGSHRPYSGFAFIGSGIKTGNLIFGGVNVTKIEVHPDERDFPDKPEVVYKTKNVASAMNERPWFLVDGIETDENLRPIMDFVNQDAAECQETPVYVEFNGEVMEFFIQPHFSQLDGKLVKRLQGRASAYCLLCSTSRKDAHLISNILDGFPMDITTEDIRANYEFWRQDDDEEHKINFKQIDPELRLQVTHEPMVGNHVQVACYLPCLHCGLRGQSWCCDLALRNDSNKYLYFVEQPKEVKEAHKAAIKQYQEMSVAAIGRALMTPGGVKGGTTDDGNTARVFFSYESRDAVCSIMVKDDPVFKQTFKKMLQYFHVILSIVNSDRLVDVDAYEEYCKEFAVFVRQSLPWAQFSPTVHALISHSAEIIRNNSNRGLLTLSEEGSEGSHKVIKQLREKGARKTGPEANLQDVMKKMWISTDKTVQSYRKVIKCTFCGGINHSVISCPKKKPVMNNPDDVIINRLTIEEDDEEEGQGNGQDNAGDN